MRWWTGLAVVALTLGACASLEDDVPDVEELRPKAAEITDLLAKNDWKAVRAEFDEPMRKGLAEDGLANVWEKVVATNGAFVSRGAPTQVPKPGNYAVFDTPMTFERGEVKSRVALRPNGEIAGLFLLEPDAD